MVEVVDSVNDYLELMKEIFDFESIRNMLTGKDQPVLKVLINSMHGGKKSPSTNQEIEMHIFEFTFSNWSLR